MDDARARRRSALAATLVALSFFASVHAVVLALALLLTPLAAVALAVDRGGRCVRALAALARRGGS
jgi:ABC-type transport system involved in cytochrome bd biosynthesis fused ATPase/permease subunit